VPVTAFQIEEGSLLSRMFLTPKVPLTSRVLSLLAVTLSLGSLYIAR
jgi:hypothetical protein